jgi:hypothetical protein
MPLHERFVYYRHRGCARTIVRREASACQNGGAKHREIAGTDCVQKGPLQVGNCGRRLAADHNIGEPVVGADRNRQKRDGIAYAGDEGHRLPHALVQSRPGSRRHLGVRGVEAQDQGPLAVEAEIHPGHGGEGADKQAGRHDENQRQTHLGHNQSLIHSRPLSAGLAAASILESRLRHCARGTQGGDQAENQRRAHGDCSSKSQHSPIERQVEGYRSGCVRNQTDEHFAEGAGEDQAQRRPQGGQQQALGQELAGEPEPGCAKRAPHAQFMPARRGPRQHEVGHVGTGKEHDHHGEQQHGQKRPFETVPQRRRLPCRCCCGGQRQIRVSARGVPGGDSSSEGGCADLRLRGAQGRSG